MSNIRYYTDGEQATADTLNRPLKDLEALSSLRTEAQIEQIAEMKRNEYASGFINFGDAPSIESSWDKVQKGLYAYWNTLQIAGTDSRKDDGDHLGSFIVNGYEMQIARTKRYWMDEGNYSSFTRIPDGPINNFSREDFVFIELWHEKVSRTGFIFMNGCVQSYKYSTATGRADLECTGKDPIQASFDGANTYSSYGTWENIDEIEPGYGYIWNDLTNEEKVELTNDTSMNLYKGNDGELYQIRYRIRVEKGTVEGDTDVIRAYVDDKRSNNDRFWRINTNADENILPQGYRNTPLENGGFHNISNHYRMDRKNIGSVYAYDTNGTHSYCEEIGDNKGKAWAIPVAYIFHTSGTVQNINFSPYGSACFINDYQLKYNGSGTNTWNLINEVDGTPISGYTNMDRDEVMNLIKNRDSNGNILTGADTMVPELYNNGTYTLSAQRELCQIRATDGIIKVDAQISTNKDVARPQDITNRFNSKDGFYWYNNNAVSGITSGYLYVELGEAKVIKRYSYVTQRPGCSGAPDSQLEGSDNNTDWTVIDGSINMGTSEITSWDIGAYSLPEGVETYYNSGRATISRDIDNTTAYKYYRLRVSGTQGCSIYTADLELYLNQQEGFCIPHNNINGFNYPNFVCKANNQYIGLNGNGVLSNGVPDGTHDLYFDNRAFRNVNNSWERKQIKTGYKITLNNYKATGIMEGSFKSGSKANKLTYNFYYDFLTTEKVKDMRKYAKYIGEDELKVTERMSSLLSNTTDRLSGASWPLKWTRFLDFTLNSSSLSSASPITITKEYGFGGHLGEPNWDSRFPVLFNKKGDLTNFILKRQSLWDTQNDQQYHMHFNYGGGTFYQYGSTNLVDNSNFAENDELEVRTVMSDKSQPRLTGNKFHMEFGFEGSSIDFSKWIPEWIDNGVYGVPISYYRDKSLSSDSMAEGEKYYTVMERPTSSSNSDKFANEFDNNGFPKFNAGATFSNGIKFNFGGQYPLFCKMYRAIANRVSPYYTITDTYFDKDSFNNYQRLLYLPTHARLSSNNDSHEYNALLHSSLVQVGNGSTIYGSSMALINDYLSASTKGANYIYYKGYNSFGHGDFGSFITPDIFGPLSNSGGMKYIPLLTASQIGTVTAYYYVNEILKDPDDDSLNMENYFNFSSVHNRRSLTDAGGNNTYRAIVRVETPYFSKEMANKPLDKY